MVSLQKNRAELKSKIKHQKQQLIANRKYVDSKMAKCQWQNVTAKHHRENLRGTRQTLHLFQIMVCVSIVYTILTNIVKTANTTCF